MTASCCPSCRPLSDRIDALEKAITEARADFEHGQRQIFLAVEYGNERAEGKRPAVNAEPASARVYQFPQAAS